MADGSTTVLQHWIDRMNAGDAAGRAALINHSCDRLRRLTRKMSSDFRRVKVYEDTNDVLQRSVLRLMRSLESVRVESVPAFFRLAARQIRRELHDLARHYYGPQGFGARHVPATPRDSSDSTPHCRESGDNTHEPVKLTLWREFHDKVEELPEEERDVFDLVWYQGTTQPEAARILGVSLATIERRWLRARVRLQDLIDDQTENEK
jgi:RNA polymerase sigma-70 factor (ECF subfamily)